jgi:hypothetical protein
MNWFVAGTLQYGKTARSHLLGMFDVLRRWFASEDFHGCAFLNAAGEIASAEDPIRIVAREHKERLLAFVQTRVDDYAAESGMDGRRAARLSRQWLILLDGAIAVALVSGEADAALDAQAAAEALLDPETAGESHNSAPQRAPKPARKTASRSPSKRPPSRRTTT